MKTKDSILKPLISVVIPMYNSEKTITSTISSVLKQSFKNWELIVINDGSTDSSLDIVQNIKDPRVFIYSQENAGVAAARNFGIQKAHADIIAFLDSDDEWLPDFLTVIHELVQQYPQCGLIATSYFLRYEGNPSLKRLTIPKKVADKHFQKITNYFQVTIEGDPIFCASSVAIRRELLQDIGGFRVGIKGGEDLLTWAKIALLSDIAYCSEPMAIYSMPAVQERNIRTLPNEDPVGDQLIEMLEGTKAKKDIPGLQAYIGHWYKIRASTYLSRGLNTAGRLYTIRAVKYSGMTFKLLLYYFTAILPKPFSGVFFRLFLKAIQIVRLVKSSIKKLFYVFLAQYRK